MKPGDRVDLSYHMDREVAQDRFRVGPPAIAIDPGKVAEDEINTLWSDMAGVKSKAERILENAAEHARKLYIPVHELATEVRTAVQRLDLDTPGGEKVTYHLYMQSVKHLTKRMTREQMIDYAGKLTGNVTVDSKTTKSTYKHDSDATAGYASSAAHAAILILATRLLAGSVGLETQKQTVTKPKAGSEMGGVLGSIVLSLVTLFALHKGEGLDVVKKAIGDMSGIEGIRDALASEGASLEDALLASPTLPPIESMPRTRAYEEPDWEVVHSYCIDWLTDTKEPGYETWLIAGDMTDIIQDLDGSLEEFTTWAAHPHHMTKDTVKLLRCKTDGLNTNLDILASVLASDYTADLVCCLVRWLGAFDVSKLKQLRNLLVLVNRVMSMKLKGLMKRLAMAWQKQLRRTVLEPLYHMIRRFFADTCKKVRDWLDPASHGDQEKWKMLFACTPIDEMVEYLLNALEDLEKLLLHLITELWDDIRLKQATRRDIYGKLADKKRLARLIRILDLVIKAMDRGNLCAEEGTMYPSDKEIRDVGRRFLGDIPGPPAFGQLVGDPYHDFNPVTFTTPLGVRIPPITEAGGERDIDRVSPEDCLKQLTDANVIPFELDKPMEVMKHVKRLRRLTE